MTRDEFNAFCDGLPATTHVVQWGNSDVWKVGGKVFAVAGYHKDNPHYEVSFKCTEIAYEVLRETPGCRPAPYLASRGQPWIQRQTAEGIDDGELKGFLTDSHRIIASGLTKKLQAELGLAG